MRFQRFVICSVLSVWVLGIFYQQPVIRAAAEPLAKPSQVSAYDLILAMNTLRVSNGLPALIEDPIVDAVAQSTAATMAANNMSWHIGNGRGRIAAAGYGGGGTVWATENFAIGYGSIGIDEIMAMWADPDHMLPAVTPAYCNIGAGAAQTSDGRTYFILQAAYVSGQACGSSSPSSSSGGTSSTGTVINPVSQIIIPVKIATPDADGKIYHTVQAGQSFWSIAIAYHITIHDIEVWNNISRNTPLHAGEKLFIPDKNTPGFATPTPVGMFVTQMPDADGKVVHVVGAYQALYTIADAYHVSVDRILQLNGLQADWPLQIGQKLVISPGNVTPSPTLNAIQKLTPAADGQYYHIVHSGETLGWIASYYDIRLSDLMAWNGLDNTSIIRPDQKLLLLVTPPATVTSTPGPPTITPSPTLTATQSVATSTPIVFTTESPRKLDMGWIFGVVAIAISGGLFWWRFSRRR